jgi:hypothetical protein
LLRVVPDALFVDALTGLRAIHLTLAPARDELVMLTTARSLVARATKKKTQDALTIVVDALCEHAGGPLDRASLDRVSDGFQRESGAWRDLDIERLNDQGLIDGYVRSYRHGRRIGRRVLEHDDPALMHRWRRWAKYSFYQLDMIRPVLCAENRACRWYLDRLGDALGKYHDLLLLRQRIGKAELDAADQLRVDAVLETNLTVYRNRARKLYSYVYAKKATVYGAGVAQDIARLSFDNVVVLPRSA